MADFLSLLLGGLPSIISNFNGSATPYLPQQEKLAKQQAELSRAQTDPNNPMYKRLYSQYQDQNRMNLAQVIAETQGQNRMNQRSGRTPLFSQERGGETLFRQLMQGYQSVNQQADQQTRQALMNAGGSTGSALTSYNNLTPYGAQSNYQKDILGYQGIANLMNPQNTGSRGGGWYPNEQAMQQANMQSANPVTWSNFTY